MFCIMEITTQPSDRGSSDFRPNPAKGNADPLRLSVLPQTKGMAAEMCKHNVQTQWLIGYINQRASYI